MLKEAREQPRIRILKDSPPGCPKDTIVGFYFDGEFNSVEIRAPPKADEKEILYILLHELDHWAQYMFLTHAECEKVMKNSSRKLSGFTPSKPFVERVNAFPSKGWGLYAEFLQKMDEMVF